MDTSRYVRRYIRILNAVIIILCIWLIFKYALPWLMPFVVAFLISRLIEPVVRALTERVHFKRGIASALCTILVFAALIALGSVIVGRIVYELSALIRDLPSLISDFSKLFTKLGEKINVYIQSAPQEVREYLVGAIDGIRGKAEEIPGLLSAKLPGIVSGLVSGVPKLLIFVFTCAVSVFFISSGYSSFAGFIMRQIPENGQAIARQLKTDLYSTFGKWLKAQLVLSAVTFGELCVSFLILRINFAVLLALLVAVLDALPLIGVGTILMPWSLICLATGEYRTSIILAVTYVIVVIVRNVLEPKVIGKQLGLAPIATLVCIYIGFKAMGFFGMILLPIALIMVKQLNDKGYLKLWK